MTEKNKMKEHHVLTKGIYFMLAIGVLTFVVTLTNLIITATNKNSCTNTNTPQDIALIDSQNQLINFNNENTAYDISSKKITYLSSNSNTKKPILTGSLGNNLIYDELEKISLEKTQQSSKVTFKTKNPNGNIELVIDTKIDGDITCNTYGWNLLNDISKNPSQEFEDCFNINDSYWYGGSESFDQQFWPINGQDFGSYQPYVTGLFIKWGSILERYWLSSEGLAIVADQSVPLFVLKNKTSICLLAKHAEPYPKTSIVSLKYDICQIDRVKDPKNYLNKLQLFVINKYFSKPSGIPDELMMKSPIWSTWANFKKEINDDVLLQFANDILFYNFTHSQLEIDDKWQVAYGDFTFDEKKFPNMSNLVGKLNQLGFRTTLWVHPFANLDSRSFLEMSLQFFAVRAPDGIRPIITSWWDGVAAVVLDTTNKNATDWFVGHLENIRQTAKIDSFKFDAGEIEWLPRGFNLYNSSITPNQYSNDFARMAHRLGNMIEVRVGSNTQDLPIFVRMLDKDSKWGYDNGLKSVITTALTMSIIGYPFILPDMIGGNAYSYIGDDIDFDADVIAYPDYQLYVRWAQVTTFLPSMQFSIPPWHYDNDNKSVAANVNVKKICRDLIDLREQLVFPLIKNYSIKSTQTGEPIIRPIWWIDNSDQQSYLVPDEFLVGNEILVAPIVDEDSYSRDIYLPPGKWAGSNGTIYSGPITLKNYSVPIDAVPYFLNQN